MAMKAIGLQDGSHVGFEHNRTCRTRLGRSDDRVPAGREQDQQRDQ
jgi:hypothetical protein